MIPSALGRPRQGRAGTARRRHLLESTTIARHALADTTPENCRAGSPHRTSRSRSASTPSRRSSSSPAPTPRCARLPTRCRAVRYRRRRWPSSSGQGRVRELRGIGPASRRGFESSSRPATIAELEELEREAPPELIGFGRLSASPQGGRFRSAAPSMSALRTSCARPPSAGRLRECPGIGRQDGARAARAAARNAPEARGRGGVCCSAPRADREATRRRVGGEVAGDVRRWRDEPSSSLSSSRAENPARALDRSPQLPEIVAVRRAGSGTERSASRSRASPVEARSPPQPRVSAPSSSAQRARTNTSSRSGRSPVGARRDRRLRGARHPVLSTPSSASSRSAASPPASRRARATSAATCTATRPGRTGRRRVFEMASAARESRLRVPRDLRPHARSRRVVPGLDAGRSFAARPRRSRPRTSCSRRFGFCAGSSATSSPTASSTSRTTLLAELDWVQATRARAASGMPRRELTKRVDEALAHPTCACLSHPTGRIIGHRPANALDLERALEVALETGVARRGQRPAGPARPARTSTSAWRVDAGVATRRSTDAHSPRGLGNMQFAVGNGAPRRGDGGGRRSTRGRLRSFWLEHRLPGPVVAHSVRSNQCDARSASTTCGSRVRRRRRRGARGRSRSRPSSSVSPSSDDERLRRQLRLGDGVVLELEVGRDLHQVGPVGTGACSSSPACCSSGAIVLPRPRAVEPHEPALARPPGRRRTAPRRRASGRGARRPRRRARSAGGSGRRESGSRSTSKRKRCSPAPSPAELGRRRRRRTRASSPASSRSSYASRGGGDRRASAAIAQAHARAARRASELLPLLALGAQQHAPRRSAPRRCPTR